MGSFLYFIVSSLLSLLIFAIFANAILSWLVAFDVINLRNQVVYNIAKFLDAVTRPILAPFITIEPIPTSASCSIVQPCRMTL